MEASRLFQLKTLLLSYEVLSRVFNENLFVPFSLNVEVSLLHKREQAAKALIQTPCRNVILLACPDSLAELSPVFLPAAAAVCSQQVTNSCFMKKTLFKLWGLNLPNKRLYWSFRPEVTS